MDAFQGNAGLADSVNQLLVIGFYLINAGYVTVTLRTGANLSNLRESIELVSDKVGVVLIVLGCMHFFNLYIYAAAEAEPGIANTRSGRRAPQGYGLRYKIKMKS